MIKPKYPMGSDISQIARSIVEHATGAPLTPLKLQNRNSDLKQKKRSLKGNPNDATRAQQE